MRPPHNYTWSTCMSPVLSKHTPLLCYVLCSCARCDHPIIIVIYTWSTSTSAVQSKQVPLLCCNQQSGVVTLLVLHMSTPVSYNQGFWFHHSGSHCNTYYMSFSLSSHRDIVTLITYQFLSFHRDIVTLITYQFLSSHRDIVTLITCHFLSSDSVHCNTYYMSLLLRFSPVLRFPPPPRPPPFFWLMVQQIR